MVYYVRVNQYYVKRMPLVTESVKSELHVNITN
jgi:hypothetical protein